MTSITIPRREVRDGHKPPRPTRRHVAQELLQLLLRTELRRIATHVSGDVAVRDSQSPSGAVLLISRADWRAFVRGLRED